MGTNDVHRGGLGHVQFGLRVPKCYKATVNESETINAPCYEPEALLFRFRPGGSSNGAELGSVRKCRTAIRSGTGDSARPQFPDPGPFLSVPDRALRRRQDVAVETAVPVAAADA